MSYLINIIQIIQKDPQLFLYYFPKFRLLSLKLKQTQFITVGRDTQLKVNDPRIQKKLKHLKMDFTIRSVFIFIR